MKEKRKSVIDVNRLSSSTLEALSLFIKSKGQMELTAEQDKEISGALSINPDNLFYKIISQGFYEEDILTKEEARKQGNVYPIERVKRSVSFQELYREIKGGRDPFTAVDLFIEEIKSNIRDKEAQRRMGLICSWIKSFLETGHMEHALRTTFWLGKEFMMERLKKHVRKQTGMNPEDTKPMKMKYGKMYHDRIFDNIKNGKRERATKDNPTTAKAEAYEFVLSAYKEATGKKFTRRNLELWRQVYLDERRLTGNS